MVEYSIYETKMLSDLNNIISKSKTVDYRKDIKTNDEALKFKDDADNIAVIIKSNNQIQLLLNNKVVKMTAPITVECQKLLLQHVSKNTFKKMWEFADLSPQDIVAAEQKRPIYNAVKNPYAKFNLLNAQKPEFVLIDEQDRIYQDHYFNLKQVLFGGSDEKKVKKTQKLFLGKKMPTTSFVSYVSKLDNGLYEAVICDAYDIRLISFENFHSEYSAYKFVEMLTGKRHVFLKKDDVPRIYIKCKYNNKSR